MAKILTILSYSSLISDSLISLTQSFLSSSIEPGYKSKFHGLSQSFLVLLSNPVVRASLMVSSATSWEVSDHLRWWQTLLSIHCTVVTQHSFPPAGSKHFTSRPLHSLSCYISLPSRISAVFHQSIILALSLQTTSSFFFILVFNLLTTYNNICSNVIVLALSGEGEPRATRVMALGIGLYVLYCS